MELGTGPALRTAVERDGEQAEDESHEPASAWPGTREETDIRGMVRTTRGGEASTTLSVAPTAM